MNKPLTPKQANNNLAKEIRRHLALVQGGILGEPTREDLEFCGMLHKLIEDGRMFYELGRILSDS